MTEESTIEVLDASGHLSFKWDPNNPEDVARARLEVKRLKAMGYTFYAVVSGEQHGDEVAVGNGQLVVEHIEEPLPPEPSVEDSLRASSGVMTSEEAAQAPEPVDVPEAAGSKKKGQKGKRTVAMRPMAGG
jgi:hypothetical protein